MKIAILTSISGLNNRLINPQQIFHGVDYHAFVDNIIPNSIWTQHINLPFTIDTQYEGQQIFFQAYLGQQNPSETLDDLKAEILSIVPLTIFLTNLPPDIPQPRLGE